MQYLTGEAYLLEHFDRQSRRNGLPQDLTLEQLEPWQTHLRAELRRVIGLDTGRSTPPEPDYGPLEKFEGYFSQRVEISTEPGIRMPLYVLTPDGIRAGETRPVVLALHGHGGGGKAAVAGRTEIPAVAEAIKLYNYDYGVQLVMAGFIVLCPDARGFGERREVGSQGDEPGKILASSCTALNNMALPLGQTVTGMWVWDLMRLIDFAATRPDWDINLLGCVGFSGGGLQALFLSALDTRVKVAVVSAYFYGYKDALLRLNNNCSCNYVPGLWQQADMGDIAALICPRPLLIESGSRDPFSGQGGLANVTGQLAITRQAYRVSEVEERIAHSVFDGPHYYSGRDVAPWLRQWLQGN
ncbi:MAG: hypothetical protein JWP00_37 [Chloroflexi bacterium]|jgi:dienelactone hydrolase|nr:hypothetical protein [Chloroflexota bacterium]